MTRRFRWQMALAVSICALIAPATTSAFCGFYVGGANGSLFNDATMVVMMREGTRTVLSMQNSYQGPPERFAMVVPVPVVLQQENVRTLEREIFARVDTLAAPRLVEYWETDPCWRPPRYRTRPSPPRAMMAPPSRAAGAGGRDLGVRIEAQFAVGEYDIVILSARDSDGLDTWLRRERYHIPPNAEPALRPYVQAGTKFFVARVDPARVTFQGGRAVLSPLRVHYDSEAFNLPVRLGLINSNGTQDLIVHILARNQRYETANYPNVFIPTNIEVRPSARTSFGAFYAKLFDATREAYPGSVITEYAWQAGFCDPCPGPTLSPSDITTLGADVAGVQMSPYSAGEWTLTRLHHRYSREGLSEDLVFRAATPVNGGTGVPNAGGRMDREVRPGGSNTFQGRYAILHRWNRPITCEHPIRGRWGGPPNGREPRPTPALDLATQPRAGAPLSSFLRQSIPQLARPRRGGGGAAPSDDPRTSARTRPDWSAAGAMAPASVSGCAIGTGSGLAGAGAIALALPIFVARRRRSRR